MSLFIPMYFLRLEIAMFFDPATLSPRAGALLMPRSLPTIPEITDASGRFEEIEAADFETFANDADDVVQFQFHPAPPEIIDPPSLDSTVWSRNPAAYFPLDQRDLYDSESSSGLSNSESDSDLLPATGAAANDLSPFATRLALGTTVGVFVGGGVAIGVIFGTSGRHGGSHGNGNGNDNDNDNGNGNGNGGDPDPSEDPPAASDPVIEATPAHVDTTLLIAPPARLSLSLQASAMNSMSVAALASLCSAIPSSLALRLGERLPDLAIHAGGFDVIVANASVSPITFTMQLEVRDGDAHTPGAQIFMTDIGAITDTLRMVCADINSAPASGLRLDFLGVDLRVGEIAPEASADRLDIITTGIAPFALNV
jgi:hypothetical protein